MNLEKGKEYFLEGRHVETSGVDHMIAGLEIEDANGKDHHHGMREVQKISIKTTHVFEKTRFNVTDFDGGRYRIVFTNPRTGLNNVSGLIHDNATADDFKKGVSAYYKGLLGLDVNVIREEFNAQETIETDPTLVTKYSYTIALKKLINYNTSETVTFAKAETKAKITYEKPADL